ncbi:MAG: NADP-dependent malic enzyme [Rickettsiales bacterium]|nr:NADP-dependent malic enzyme [Rickettsiales bacterium]
MPDNKTQLHIQKLTDKDALDFHEKGRPGKITITPSKPLTTQRDLSLAYSPGVAIPCLEIQKNPSDAYRYTSKGNLVAVISNGTAVLGLGNLGALASKPVMEGKAVLFKRFADIDSVDIEVDTEDADEFINAVKYLSPSWGGINLEDIKAPECFIIEKKLKELLDIPVFHDDQHGTAVITAAGIINAAHITNKKLEDLTIVVNGAGSAGIACLELIKSMGIPDKNCYLCDTRGIIYKGREAGMNEWKAKHANDTSKRTLSEALIGADVFLGLSVKGAVTKEMVKAMAKQPIIFAMANPDPEILPEDAREVCPDAIIATGRSDYQNQINNVMGFPYIFRGALDVQASSINEEMKIAAAQALAELAREPVPEEVSNAYLGRKMKYGPDYIIPVPFDPRLIHTIPVKVAEAAIKSGVARKPISNMDHYKNQLASRLNPAANNLNLIFGKIRNKPTSVVFAEGENLQVLGAAKEWQDSCYGQAILLTRTDRAEELEASLTEYNVNRDNIKIINISDSEYNTEFAKILYTKLQRKGYLYRDCERMVRDDRNIFASCAITSGLADIAVTGATRNYKNVLDDIEKVIDVKENHRLFGYSMICNNDRSVFIADTAITELSSSREMAEVAIQLSKVVIKLGHTPRVAFVSFSNFGNQIRQESSRIKDAKEILDAQNVDFEYDGEMSPDVALNENLLRLYPFANLSKPANILIMPGLHSAIISSKLYSALGEGIVIGPVLDGLEKTIQIVPLGASTSEIINIAAIAASLHGNRNGGKL